uniref:Lipocalin/cytosolic fatty-acid binding domain-containing protein n=1 Tax=Lygus hesperus TaxID=30085 RepID=A0A0K8SRZ6_LYGHE
MRITLRLATLLVVLGLAYCQKSCPTLERPASFDKTQFVGTWYAVRGIEHTEKSNSNTSKQSKKCSEITISPKNGGESWKFNWVTKNKPAKQFTLKHSAKAPGLLEGNGKGSFNSVQITRVTDEPKMWAATFCRTNGGISTVVLSNVASFDKAKVDKVTQKLAAQGLDVSNSYDRCTA